MKEMWSNGNGLGKHRYDTNNETLNENKMETMRGGVEYEESALSMEEDEFNTS